MRKDKTLIREEYFEHEGFAIHGEVYNVTLWEKYSNNTQKKYAIELTLKDIMGDTHTYTDTVPKTKVGKRSTSQSFFDRLLRRDVEQKDGYYESLYDFVVDSVLDAADEATDEQLEVDDDKSSEPEVQAELAFDSLSEQ